MASRYLQVAFAEGKFFEYAKEMKEGFQEHFNKKGEKKGYRKHFDNIVGTLESMRIVQNQHLTGNPEELQVSFKEENGDYVNLTMMLLDMNKDYATFVESLLVHLPKMEKGVVYTVAPYNFENDKGRKIAGFSIKQGEEKVVKLVQSAVYKDGTVKEGEIPAVKWSENKRTGKPEANTEDKFFYLKGVLDKSLERFVFVNNTPTSSIPQTATPPSTPPASKKKEDDDNLPF